MGRSDMVGAMKKRCAVTAVTGLLVLTAGSLFLYLGSGGGAFAAMLLMDSMIMAQCAAASREEETHRRQLKKSFMAVDKAMESRREEKRRQMEDVRWLKSMLSHNVRMPLSIIAGYADLLKRDMIQDEMKKTECLEKICGNITYLTHMVNLVLGRGEENDVSYDFRQMDLLICLKEVTGYVKETAQKYHITVRVNASGGSLMVSADYMQMMRVFYNLLENSFRYMMRPGSIVITADRAGEDEVLIIYKDDGMGMRQDEVTHIFEPAYRGSNSSCGSGLGMSFVKEVIEKHGGTVSVLGDLGKGLCIYIKLPVRGGNL